MITLTWIDGKPTLFNETEQVTYGVIKLKLYGDVVSRSVGLDYFDKQEFIEITNCKLMRILYGVDPKEKRHGV